MELQAIYLKLVGATLDSMDAVVPPQILKIAQKI